MASELQAQIPLPLRNIECQTIIAYKDVIYHGHLRKRSTVNKLLGQMKVPFKWKQVYVVLKGGCIYFYNDETSLRARATSLYGFTSVERCPLEVQKENPWPFKIVCALQERDEEYIFCAASEKELMTWMTLIKEQIEYANGFSLIRSPSDVHPIEHPPPEENQTKPEENRKLPPVPVADTLKQLQDYASDSSSSEDEETDSTPKGFPPTGKTGKCRSAAYEGVELKATNAAPRNQKLTGTVSPLMAKAPETSPQQFVPNAADLKKPWLPAAAVDSSTKESRISKQLPIELAIADAYWDKGPEEADEFMKCVDYEGAYMIRCSTDQKSQTLLVRAGKCVRKFKIQRMENKFSLDSQGPSFESLTQMVNHFKINEIPQRQTKLTKPFSAIRKC